MSRSDSGRRKILVAVAWPYASGLRHIGHVAGFGVPSDTFARYHRLRGNDVLMVSGTDEHGTPVMVAADAAVDKTDNVTFSTAGIAAHSIDARQPPSMTSGSSTTAGSWARSATAATCS